MSIERTAPKGFLGRLAAGKALPILVVVAVIVAIWYVAAFFMNADLQRDSFANAGKSYTTEELVAGTMSQERPRLPAPHQIVEELDKTVIGTAPSSKRSLVYHGGVTLEATLLGFLSGSLLGMLLAVLIVHAASLEKSLMPWIIASQTVPIIALAPMIVVIMNQFDVTGIVPKATISAYLSFFPVTVGMVKGLRSPDPLQLDLMRTYSASRLQTFFKLRAPASVPFLFASLKVAVAASLVGAVVAEMTKSEDGGFGARLLAGSYYGQTIQIWAALFAAAFCAAALVMLVGLIDRVVSKRMGYAR
jgi:NitT/TauT family transport system permease protein